MGNKRKVYEVLEEKISPDNIVRIGELLALGALKYMCRHKMLHGMYADLARDIANKDVEGYVLSARGGDVFMPLYGHDRKRRQRRRAIHRTVAVQ